MPPIAIKPDIYWIGVNDHQTELFEGLWPIKDEGVSYNAYLIRDEKTALIDLTKEFMTEPLLEQIKALTDLAAVDYIIINHMEPDHSGALKHVLDLAPDAMLVGTPKTKEMLASFYGITERIQVVEDGETLSLGTHTLRFVHTPFVHWPETMMTYEETNRILFSCDGFGGYGVVEDGIFDDETDRLDYYKQESMRYFTNIVLQYSKPTLRAISKLEDVPVDIIAPSHGLIWRDHPEDIVGLYKQWAEWGSKPERDAITLLYASMYGNTERMMESVAKGAQKEGVELEIIDVTQTHPSYILPALLRNKAVIIGAPTYDGALFPTMAHLLDFVARKRVQNRILALFGSYAWSAGARKEMEAILAPLKWNWIDTFEFAGGPEQEDLSRGEALGAHVAQVVLTGQE